MYRELRENIVKTGTQMNREHDGLAYLMLDIFQERKNDVLQEPQGLLYAIADEAGLEQLNQTAMTLLSKGHRVLVDTNPLYVNDTMVV